MNNNINESKINQFQMEKLILPILFCTSLIVIGFINISNFQKSYNTSLEENEDDIQKALYSIESKYAESFVSKNNYISLNGLFSKIIDEKEVNEVIKLDNGHLMQSHSLMNLENQLSEVVKLDKVLKEKDIEFIYIFKLHII